MPEPDLRAPITEAELAELGVGRELEEHRIPKAGALSRALAAVRGFIRVNGGFTVRPHVQAFANACNEATGASSFGTYNGHSPTPDRALDIFTPTNSRTLGDAISNFAIRNVHHYGVDYVIYRQHIWNPEVAPHWRLMPDRGSPTQNHIDHVHISFEPTGAATPAPNQPPAAPAPPKEDQLFSRNPDPNTPCGYIVSRATEQPIDVSGHGNAAVNGADAGLWSIDGQLDQRVRLLGVGNGETNIISLAKNQFGKPVALDSPGGSEVWWWEHNPDNANQRVRLLRLPFGLFQIEFVNRDGMVLTADGGMLVLQPKRTVAGSPDPAQVFDFAKTI